MDQPGPWQESPDRRGVYTHSLPSEIEGSYSGAILELAGSGSSRLGGGAVANEE
jgi:hypothetical protein